MSLPGRHEKINNIYAARLFTYFAIAIFFPFYAIWIFDLKLLPVSQVAFVVSLLVILARLSSLFFVKVVQSYDQRWVLIVAVCSKL